MVNTCWGLIQAYNKDAEEKMRQMEKTIRNQSVKLEKMETVLREVENSKQDLEGEHQLLLKQMEVSLLG